MDVENGESLTPDDIADIHKEADEDVRGKMKLRVNTRNKKGDIEDFLETRRPFAEKPMH